MKLSLHVVPPPREAPPLPASSVRLSEPMRDSIGAHGPELLAASAVRYRRFIHAIDPGPLLAEDRLPMALRETEEWLVARVVCERLSEFVIRCQLDTEGKEPLEQLGTVGIEEVRETHAVWVGAPFEEKVKKVPPSRTKCEVQRGAWLQVRVVAVAEKEKRKRMMSRL